MTESSRFFVLIFYCFLPRTQWAFDKKTLAYKRAYAYTNSRSQREIRRLRHPFVTGVNLKRNHLS